MTDNLIPIVFGAVGGAWSLYAGQMAAAWVRRVLS